LEKNSPPWRRSGAILFCRAAVVSAAGFRPFMGLNNPFHETEKFTWLCGKRLPGKTKSPLTQRAFVKLCHFKKIWSGRRDSNPRPRPWQGRALPLSYTRIREIGGERSPATGRAMPNAASECNSPCETGIPRISGYRPELAEIGQFCHLKCSPMLINRVFAAMTGNETGQRPPQRFEPPSEPALRAAGQFVAKNHRRPISGGYGCPRTD
jgi:hypothetical protein